jgi:hypothetical protein
MSCLAFCCILGVTVRLCVGVDVATNGRASEMRATCVKIGGMATIPVTVIECIKRHKLKQLGKRTVRLTTTSDRSWNYGI